MAFVFALEERSNPALVSQGHKRNLSGVFVSGAQRQSGVFVSGAQRQSCVFVLGVQAQSLSDANRPITDTNPIIRASTAFRLGILTLLTRVMESVRTESDLNLCGPAQGLPISRLVRCLDGITPIRENAYRLPLAETPLVSGIG
jgi:hypothetical protein